MNHLFSIIICSMAIAQNINYYDADGESFADVIVNELTFTCRVAGMENDGDAVILLHGFPETSRMWYDLIPVLVSEGFKVVAPDQRGYSNNARPPKISDYSIDKLSQDIIDIANAFQFEKFHLVGHDWGSAVGWAAVAIHSDRIVSWTALSVPHLDAFFEAIKNDELQKQKSQYIKFFKKPIFPEIYFSIFGYKYLKDIWRKSSQDEIEKYIEVFKQKGALKSSLNWYRANMKNENNKIGEISTPTLIIYGLRDMAIGEKSVDESEKFLKGEYKIEKLEAGHWLIQESFESVSNSILKHVSTYSK
ncbi:MAG: alpha/beta hydrolase [Candidatus Marinimicrobia bacterium]|nr:alpha/beta hydrolase [Candidatus Neomarinimicrobiota bacterium]